MKEPVFQGAFEIKANICLVDAINFTKVAPFLKPVISQVQWADLLYISKTDIASKEEIETVKKLLDNYNTDAKIITGVDGESISSCMANVQRIKHKALGISSEPPKDIVAVSFSEQRIVDKRKFSALIADLDDTILRLKGNSEFQDGLEVEEGVSCNITFKKPVEKVSGKTVFTVIAWKIYKDKLSNLFWELFI